MAPTWGRGGSSNHAYHAGVRHTVIGSCTGGCPVPQELLAFYDALILPTAPSAHALCCEVWGGSSRQPYQAHAHAQAPAAPHTLPARAGSVLAGTGAGPGHGHGEGAGASSSDASSASARAAGSAPGTAAGAAQGGLAAAGGDACPGGPWLAVMGDSALPQWQALLPCHPPRALRAPPQ